MLRCVRPYNTKIHYILLHSSPILSKNQTFQFQHTFPTPAAQHLCMCPSIFVTLRDPLSLATSEAHRTLVVVAVGKHLRANFTHLLETGGPGVLGFKGGHFLTTLLTFLRKDYSSVPNNRPGCKFCIISIVSEHLLCKHSVIFGNLQ